MYTVHTYMLVYKFEYSPLPVFVFPRTVPIKNAKCERNSPSALCETY